MTPTRLYAKKIYEAFSNPFITLLTGPRRVGKSFLVQQYLQTHAQHSSLLLNLDELDLRARIDAGKLSEELEKRLGRRLDTIDQRVIIVIDEAQKSPALFDQIKLMYDRFKPHSKIKFILTGSGALSLHQHSAETLAGRIFLYELFPFGLEEAARFRLGNTALARPLTTLLLESPRDVAHAMLRLEPHRAELQRLLSELLIWGGFPEVLALPDHDARKTYLANYRQTYLEKDIRAIDSVGDITAFNHVLEIIASQVGSPRQDKRLYETIGISAATFKKYLSILAATFLYTEIPPYIHSPLRRIVKAPKAYLADNGLLSYLRGLYDIATLEQSAAIGAWFENFALGALRTVVGQHAVPPKIYYWRTSGNVEVDFVIHHEANIIPVEVKYAKRIDPRLTKHLREFLHHEKRATFGVVFYQGEFHFDERERIYYIPAWAAV